MLGDGYFKLKDFQKAFTKYKWIEDSDIKKTPDFMFSLYYKMAICLENTDAAQAVEYYQKAMQIKPDDEMLRLSYEEYVIRNSKVDDEVRKELAQTHYEMAMKLYAQGNHRWYQLHLKRAVNLYPFYKEARRKLVDFYEMNKDYAKAYDELNSLFKVDQSYDIKGKIEAYNWKIKNNELNLEKNIIYEYNGIILIDSDYYDFERVFPSEIIYTSKYFDKFKFSSMEYRKEEGMDSVLEYVRKNNVNFFIIVNFDKDKGVLDCSVYDQTGQEIDKISMSMDKNRKNQFSDLIDRFYTWVDGAFPLLGYVSSAIDAKTLRLSYGSAMGMKAGDELLAFEYKGDIIEKGTIRVDKPQLFLSEGTIIQKSDERDDLIGKMIIKNDSIVKKHLTKLKRILVY